MRNLCLAGGVALNCVANGAILRDGRFDRIWIQPAAGDAGGALGAALTAHHLLLRAPRLPADGRDAMRGSFLGPAYAQADIERRLTAEGATFTVLRRRRAVRRLRRGHRRRARAGLVPGRGGVRSAGAGQSFDHRRSRARAQMQSTLNLKVKFRESFRPFAPAVLREDVADWFDLDLREPVHAAGRATGGAAAHSRRTLRGRHAAKASPGSRSRARPFPPSRTSTTPRACRRSTARRTRASIACCRDSKALTGCPVLVNTSFNVRGEPPVLTPEDAFRCFMGTDIEVLVFGNCYLRKDAQDARLARDYRAAFAPD